MFIQATLSQIRFLLRQKSAVIVFYILLGLVMLNYISNVFIFQGTDVSAMVQPMRILLLSMDLANVNPTYLLILAEIYPLLVVFAAGFALVKEKQSGLSMLLEARLGRRSYLFSKLLAVFLTTVLVFTVPFLLEIVLNCLAFPLTASGDFTNGSIYDPEPAILARNYFLSGLYYRSPYLYAVAGTFLFGVLSGVLAVLTFACSLVFKIKYRIVLFLPVFLFLNASIFLSGVFSGLEVSIQWADYFFLFNSRPKNIFIFIVVILVLTAVPLYLVYQNSRKDNLG